MNTPLQTLAKIADASPLLARPCFHCGKPMLYSRGQFKMTHRECRAEFRRIHGAFRQIPRGR